MEKVIPMIEDNQVLAFMREQAYKPMTYQELVKHFAVEGAEQFKAFLKVLNHL
jgi:ribonuclease R